MYGHNSEKSYRGGGEARLRKQQKRINKLLTIKK